MPILGQVQGTTDQVVPCQARSREEDDLALPREQSKSGLLTCGFTVDALPRGVRNGTAGVPGAGRSVERAPQLRVITLTARAGHARPA
jgi:hypothetical protein